jgi:hypothetical protein
MIPAQPYYNPLFSFLSFDDIHLIDKFLVVALYSIIALNIIHLDVHNTVGLGYMVKLF